MNCLAQKISPNMRKSSPDPDLSIEFVRSILSYDPDTGVFTRKISRGPMARVGEVVGNIGNHGYRRIKISDRSYLLHRLAWFYVHAVWPTEEIDHRDGNRLNNSIANLRIVTRAQNCKNMTCEKGFSFVPKTGKYQVRMQVNGKTRLFGSFATAEKARSVYLAAHLRIHGELSPYNGQSAIRPSDRPLEGDDQCA